jgi:hypothetical protein
MLIIELLKEIGSEFSEEGHVPYIDRDGWNTILKFVSLNVLILTLIALIYAKGA